MPLSLDSEMRSARAPDFSSPNGRREAAIFRVSIRKTKRMRGYNVICNAYDYELKI